MDVVVVRGVDEAHSESMHWNTRSSSLRPLRWLEAVIYTVAATLITLLMNRAGFSEANLIMIFLLTVVAVAARCGSLPSIAASVASVVIFDVLFVPPYYRITVYDSQYVVTFAVMLIVGYSRALSHRESVIKRMRLAGASGEQKHFIASVVGWPTREDGGFVARD